MSLSTKEIIHSLSPTAPTALPSPELTVDITTQKKDEKDDLLAEQKGMGATLMDIVVSDDLEAFKKRWSEANKDETALAKQTTRHSSLIVAAAGRGSENIFKSLLSQGINPTITISEFGTKTNALEQVCTLFPLERHKERLAIAKILVEEYKMHVNAMPGFYTALHKAALYQF